MEVTTHARTALTVLWCVQHVFPEHRGVLCSSYPQGPAAVAAPMHQGSVLELGPPTPLIPRARFPQAGMMRVSQDFMLQMRM